MWDGVGNGTESVEFTLRFGEEELRNTRWTWGLDWPTERRSSPGWGASVEVSAILELLELAAAGQITPAEARDALADAARQLAAACDADGEWKRNEDVRLCSGADCQRCEANRSKVEAFHRAAAKCRERYADHAAYPYAAGSTTLHRVKCKTVESVGQPSHLTHGLSEEEALEDELRRYTHGGFGTVRPRLDVFSVKEAVAWTQARTGPRGGAKYRLCKLCEPAAPTGNETHEA